MAELVADQTYPPRPLVDTAHSPEARLSPVPPSAVTLSRGFWAERLRIVRRFTLPSQFEQLESTGRLDHFRRAAGRLEGPFVGHVYDDSDVYKWLEAVGWALAGGPDADLQALGDQVIELIASAQEPDGYLNTYFTFENAPLRWSNLKDWHELYCAGHLIQAGIAYRRATGRQDLLDIAARFADLICQTFGPREGQRQGVPGHPGIEMALVELYRQTGHERYLHQASYFLEARGHGLIGGQAYHQDQRPFQGMTRMSGHAVRMAYLCAGAADIYLETGDKAILEALERLWACMTTSQMYLTGGIGARALGEAFGEDYELPNQHAYAESCAAIGSLFWNWRMLQGRGEARFADLIETILYNGALVGLSADGRSYFYRNLLASSGGFSRQDWYSCACCPPNLARLLAALPGFFYGQSGEGLWIHQYGASELDMVMPDGTPVSLVQRTEYPWDGRVVVEVRSRAHLAIFLRLPGWVGDLDGDNVEMQVNGDPVRPAIDEGGYASISRHWAAGDTLQLQFPMPVRRLASHPRVTTNHGHLALVRGPLVYCLEQADQPDLENWQVVIPRKTEFRESWRSDILGGLMAIRGRGKAIPLDPAWEGKLTRSDSLQPNLHPGKEVELQAIPYFAWANRGPGWMQVWSPT